MVLAVKVFEIREKMELPLMVRKLKDFREEEPYESGGKKLSLRTEVLDLKVEEGGVTGVFSKDFVLSRYYRRGVVEVPVTEEVPFWIRPFRGRTFLTVLAPSKARGVKKLLTNYVANKLSEVLFLKTGAIVEGRITHETLRELHESNPQATKLIWFDDIDIPNVGKVALAGSALADSRLYREYLEHGKIWYAVFEFKKYHMVVGITRNCVVTTFSRVELKDFLECVFGEILPLIS
jgi:hypothetical protein